MIHETYRIPALLAPGSDILLAAPARFVMESQVHDAVAVIRDAGFNPVVPEGLLQRAGQFGGADAHRAAILNAGFADDGVRAIWAMRGGYGCGRILPLLDAQAFKSDPKWLIGFSDVTALHGWAQRQGVASLHAPVANTFSSSSESAQQHFWQALTEESPMADVPVVGGNLSVLYSLLGTPYFPDCTGAWLVLEDLDEYIYHIDRMLLALRLAGVFEKAHGLLMGDFLDLHDNTIADGQAVDNPFGQGLVELIQTHWPQEKPLHWGVPIGHGQQNEPLMLGAGLNQAAHWVDRF